MSFQTFNLFNFFQQPNTGKNKILSEEEREVAKLPQINNSGAVADFNWFFPYARKIIPNAIILGETSSFPFKLYSDSLEIYERVEDSVFGIRYPKFNISLSGRFTEDINKIFSKISFSGKVFPKESELEKIKLDISGLIINDKPDICNNKLNISGEALNAKSEVFNLKSKISGNISKTFFDFSSIKVDFSGIIKKENIDFNFFNLKINGNFYPLFKDQASLEYSLLSYSTGEGILYLKEDLDDEINNLTYALESYNKNDE